MKELLLEHRGYTCIAKLYEDGRWGFGNSEDIEGSYTIYLYKYKDRGSFIK